MKKALTNPKKAKFMSVNRTVSVPKTVLLNGKLLERLHHLTSDA